MAIPEAGGFRIAIDPQQWHRFGRELQKFDPALKRALMKRIRNAGNIAREAVIKELEKSSPDGGPDEKARRAELIAATKVTVSFRGTNAAGARVVTSSRNLPEEHKGLLKVYNLATFRHPVYARGDGRTDWTWVQQKGRPYFGTAIRAAMSRALAEEITAAIQEAVDAIGAKGRI
ncbi:hypothetical protein ACFVTX_18205 [Agromyces sp. NPDC058136]|uniref:hypothetical protein n=1 Tax=Agromyces sp. NPDC058136 TaxID=3346354 RepID=UPI0036D8AE5A